MTVKYEYKSACCGHEYLEIRAVDEPLFKPTCNKCGVADYELVNETVLSKIVERAAPDVVVEETPAE